jgi:hypothetical protein
LTRYRDNFLPHTIPDGIHHEKAPEKAAIAAVERGDMEAAADHLLDATPAAVEQLPDTLTVTEAKELKAEIKRLLDREVAARRAPLAARESELDQRESDLTDREEALLARRNALDAGKRRLESALEDLKLARQQVRDALAKAADEVENEDPGERFLGIRLGAADLDERLRELAESLRSRADQV